MRLFAAAVVAALGFAVPVLAFTEHYTATYDTSFDIAHTSLSRVACSSGEHGLITAGFTTFGSLPTFPYIGGAPQILGWNSPYCGSCWELTYTDKRGYETSVNITAIDTGDHGDDSFNISLEGMDVLAPIVGVGDGRVPVKAVRLPKSACGL